MASVHKGFVLPGKAGKLTLATGTNAAVSIDVGIPSLQVAVAGFQADAANIPLAITRDSNGHAVTPTDTTAEAIAVLGIQPA